MKQLKRTTTILNQTSGSLYPVPEQPQAITIQPSHQQELTKAIESIPSELNKLPNDYLQKGDGNGGSPSKDHIFGQTSRRSFGQRHSSVTVRKRGPSGVFDYSQSSGFFNKGRSPSFASNQTLEQRQLI